VIILQPKILPLALNVEEASEYLGSHELLRKMRAAAWIKPVVERHKLTLFDRAELETCYSRVRAGEFPSV
jgi:hypothetical protein